jgi:hypothetical protein
VIILTEASAAIYVIAKNGRRFRAGRFPDDPTADAAYLPRL